MLCMAYFTVGSDEERMKQGLKKFALAACAANNNNNHSHSNVINSNGSSNGNGTGAIVSSGIEGGNGTSSTSVTSSSVKLSKRMSFNETYVTV